MTQDQKHIEYNLMETSDKRTIRLQIPNGPSLVCHNSWDYTTNLKETTFKTATEVTKEHPLLSVTALDLSPVTNKKIWIIRVLRQPESNLKNEQPRKIR